MRTFHQKRARDTHAALLRAAARVFAERGFDGAQAPAIAKAAGVSTGAFYRYFEDKRHAFLEMIAHETERAHRSMLAEIDVARFAAKGKKGARAAIGAALETLFAMMRADTPLLRVYFHMSLRDPDVAAIRASYDSRAREMIAQVIGALVPRAVIADPPAAALVIQIAAVEVVSERMDLRPRDARLSDESVLGALGDMIYAFALRKREAPQRPSGPRSSPSRTKTRTRTSTSTSRTRRK